MNETIWKQIQIEDEETNFLNQNSELLQFSNTSQFSNEMNKRNERNQQEMKETKESNEIKEINITKQLTIEYIDILCKYNKNIQKDKIIIRKILTIPSNASELNPKDNELSDLIVRVYDCLESNLNKQNITKLYKEMKKEREEIEKLIDNFDYSSFKKMYDNNFNTNNVYTNNNSSNSSNFNDINNSNKIDTKQISTIQTVITKSENEKILNNKYKVISLIGKGSFGEVFRCLDLQTNQLVAIKILKSQLVYLRQGMLELAILSLLNEYYDQINKYHTVRMYDHFLYENHLCIVFELLSINLLDALKMNDYKGFPYNFNQSVSKQLLQTLTLLSDKNIIHCDIKPENIMLMHSSSKIRLIDFGSACFTDTTMYTYIQSRYYRAPEIILGIPYNCSIDMWSVGCVIAELFLGIPLFSGTSEYNQLYKFIQLLGMPENNVLKRGSKTDQFFWHRNPSPKISTNRYGEITTTDKIDDDYFVLKTRYEYEKSTKTHIQANNNYFNETTFEGVMKNAFNELEMNEEEGEIVIDFLKKIFVYDPYKRMTPYEALKHPFIVNLEMDMKMYTNGNDNSCESNYDISRDDDSFEVFPNIEIDNNDISEDDTIVNNSNMTDNDNKEDIHKIYENEYNIQSKRIDTNQNDKINELNEKEKLIEASNDTEETITIQCIHEIDTPKQSTFSNLSQQQTIEYQDIIPSQSAGTNCLNSVITENLNNTTTLSNTMKTPKYSNKNNFNNNNIHIQKPLSRTNNIQMINYDNDIFNSHDSMSPQISTPSFHSKQPSRTSIIQTPFDSEASPSIKLSGDQACDIVYGSTHPIPQQYNAENYYITYLLAYHNGIILNILDSNPFNLPTLHLFHPTLGFSILLHRSNTRNSLSKTEDFVPLPFKQPTKVINAKEKEKQKTPLMTHSDGSVIVAATGMDAYNNDVMSIYEDMVGGKNESKMDDYLSTLDFDMYK